MPELPKNIIPGDSADADALIDQNIADIASAIFGRGKKQDTDKPGVVSGAVEAPVGGVAPVPAVEDRPARKTSRTKKPTAGADVPTQPDLQKAIGDVSPDSRKQEFLADFVQIFGDLKAQILGAVRIESLRDLRRHGKGEVYRFFDLNNFSEYLNSLLGERSKQEREEAFERITVAEKELELLYRARRKELEEAGAPVVDKPERGKNVRNKELQQLCERWLGETRQAIISAKTVDELKDKKLTGIFGKRTQYRNFVLPDGLKRILGKGVPLGIKESFSADLKELMDLWQEQLVKVLFADPAAESGFAGFLETSFQELKNKKLRKTDFFERCCERLGLKEKELGDLAKPRLCKALQSKLHELYDKHFPIIEAAQQIKGNGGKPEDKKPTNEELFALLVKNLEATSRFTGESGGELVIESVGQDVITYKYRARGKRDWLKLKTKPDGAKKLITLLETEFDWKIQVSKAEGGLDAAQQDPLWQEQTLKDLLNQPDTYNQFEKLLDRSFKELLDGTLSKNGLFDRFKNKFNVVKGFSKQKKNRIFQEKLGEFWERYFSDIGTEYIEKYYKGESNKRERYVVNSLTKQSGKWIIGINAANTQEEFDTVKTEAEMNGSQDGVPMFVVGKYLDSLLEKYPPATPEEKEKLTKLANVFQDGISEVYLRKGIPFHPEMKEKMDLKDRERKERARTYEELEKALLKIKRGEYASVVTEGLVPYRKDWERGKAEHPDLKFEDVIGHYGIDKVAESFSPFIIEILPRDWKEEEQTIFALEFSKKVIAGYFE